MGINRATHQGRESCIETGLDDLGSCDRAVRFIDVLTVVLEF